MSENKFSRSRSDASSRNFGDAPILGKVNRTPGSALPRKRGKGSLKRRRKGRPPNKVALSWALLISFIAMVVATVFTVSYVRGKAANANNADGQGGSSVNLDRAFSERKKVDLPRLESVDGLTIVESALANRDPGLVRKHFTLGKGGDPHAAIEALTEIIRREGKISGTEWLGEKFTNGRVMAECVVFMGSKPGGTNRLAQLTVGDDGKWRVDLDSYLRKCSPDWKEILSGEPMEATVRIFLAADTYYNGPFSDDTKWKAYAMVSPDLPNILYGYAALGSRQDKALRQILSSDEKIHRATLGIRSHPAAGTRQFEITRVLAENWVVGEAAFDEGF